MSFDNIQFTCTICGDESYSQSQLLSHLALYHTSQRYATDDVAELDVLYVKIYHSIKAN